MRRTGRWIRQGRTVIVLGLDRDGAPRGEAREVAADGEIGGAHPTLRRGSSGSAVRDLQLLLRTRGFDPGSIDGAFGARTDAAVRSFQRARGLAADGIVGSNTWSALTAGPGPRPPAPGTSPAPRPAPGTDPAIDALGLSEPARSAAYSIKARHPWVVFTSGRRDPARQAWAMAGNVVRNRQWIAQTYASNPVSRAAQAWVDAHPEARTQQAVAEGLTSVFAGFSARDLGRLSYHLSGLAFDIQPVPAQAGAVTATVRSLPGVKEFLTREGGLTIWHVAF